MARILLCLSMLLTVAQIRAENFLSEGLYYSITSDNTVMVVSETSASGGSTIGIGFAGGYEGDVVIPQTVEHNGVTYTVTAVEKGTFSMSPRLTSVSIPSTVLTIGDSPFVACNQLTAVVVDSGNPAFLSEDGVLYNKEKTLIICCPATKIGSFDIPQSVTEIANSAFYGCQYLTAVTIPESVLAIGAYAFRGCSTMQAAIVPEGVTNISKGTFQECRQLSSITLPESVTRVEDMAFYYCQRLQTIQLPSQLQHIGNAAFRNCSQLKVCSLPEGIDSIGEYAFASCGLLEALYLPASVVSFGVGAVSECSSMTEISVEETNQYYRSLEGVLYTKDLTKLLACPGAKTGEIVVPSPVVEVVDLAFTSCMKLTGIRLPVSVKKIGHAAFSGCHGLKTLVIPNQVEEIEQYAFAYCSSLTRVTSYITNVSAITTMAFSSTTFSNVPLYVPARYINRYKNADGWKYFNSIQPIVEDVTVSTGEAYTPALFDITIDMVNAEADLQSCEMELVLPEGFELLQDDNGVTGYTLGERIREYTPEITFSQTEEGTYIIQISFENITGNIGNEGTLLTLKGMADAEITAGDYEGQIKNVLSYTGNYTTTPDNSVFDIHLQEALPGDVNRDGIVNITDVMLTVNYAVGQLVSSFVSPLADMNHDTQISITDIMHIVNLITGN